MMPVPPVWSYFRRNLATTVVLGLLLSSHAVAPAQSILKTEQLGPAKPWEADPSLVEKLRQRRDHPFNYVESEVPKYSLPDLFLANRNSVQPDHWPQLREKTLDLFRRYVYGRRPEDTGKVSFSEAEMIADPTDGLAVGKRVFCEIAFAGNVFRFPFLVYMPKQVDGNQRIPLIILINNRYLPDPDKLKESPDPFWPVDEIIRHGFATAVFHTSDVDPDRADGYQQGIRGFLAHGEPRSEEDWGALSAWGWGASRVLDYAVEKLPIAPEMVAVVGHSRGGKTALWAAAEDPRFAISYSNESGCGGAALSRRRYGETVGRITKSFPHWFCPRFASFSDNEDQLPVDQHQLIALQAPRAVYVASAAEDLWADPRGEYLALINAAPAYEFLGLGAISDETMPPLDAQRIVGKTGYHIRAGEHNLTKKDWLHFLEFAKRQFAENQ